jgi:hypothetical protein
MGITDKTRWLRGLGLACGVCLLMLAAYALYQKGPSGLAWLPGCSFHKLTGFNCPGCGMTRAAYATLHGHFAQAFRDNPVGMVLLPLAFLALGIQLLGWVRGRPMSFQIEVGSKGAWMIVIVIICFWILRNIPDWPFTLLSPP